MLNSTLALHGALLSLALCVLAGCGGDDVQTPTVPPEPGTSSVDVSTQQDSETSAETADARADGDSPRLPDAEKLKAEHAERLKTMNAHGRGLLTSFESRAYSARRDADLRAAGAVVSIRVDETDGAFLVTYDAALADGERVVVTPDPENGELPRGTAEQVRRFATLSFDGAYREVVHYLPPSNVLVSTSRDKKHRVVTAQPHKHAVQVSYSVDANDMVAIRGTSVIPNAEIVHYTWETWRGRQLLSGMSFYGTDARTDFTYDDKDTSGVVLLERAVLRKGDHTFDAVFRYESIDVGTE